MDHATMHAVDEAYRALGEALMLLPPGLGMKVRDKVNTAFNALVVERRAELRLPLGQQQFPYKEPVLAYITPTFRVDGGFTPDLYGADWRCAESLVRRLRLRDTGLPFVSLSFSARGDGLYLQTSIRVLDRDTGKPDHVTNVASWSWYVLEQSQHREHVFVRVVQNSLTDILRHELDESIEWDGKLASDPHAGGAP